MTARELIPSARAAWWAARSIRRAKTVELTSPIPAQLPPVPPLPPAAITGVKASLRVARVPCLARAIVLQAWLLSHDEPHDLVIGVTRPGEHFGAHAWLDADAPCHAAEFHELTRHAPR